MFKKISGALSLIVKYGAVIYAIIEVVEFAQNKFDQLDKKDSKKEK